MPLRPPAPEVGPPVAGPGVDLAVAQVYRKLLRLTEEAEADPAPEPA